MIVMSICRTRVAEDWKLCGVVKTNSDIHFGFIGHRTDADLVPGCDVSPEMPTNETFMVAVLGTPNTGLTHTATLRSPAQDAAKRTVRLRNGETALQPVSCLNALQPPLWWWRFRRVGPSAGRPIPTAAV